MRGIMRGVAAAEPQGPPRHLPLLKPAPAGARRQRRRAVAACVAIQVIAVIAVYQAHALYVVPRVRGPATAEAPSRRELGAAAAAFSGSTPGPNCTVRLADADEGVLRREVEAIVRSLTGEQGWVLAAADDGSAEERGDRVRRGEVYPERQGSSLRVVDEGYGRKGNVNIPGVEDLHAELAAYDDAMAAAMTADVAVAAARQRRTTAAELGLVAEDPMDEVASIPARVAFLNGLADEVLARESTRVCFATTAAPDLMGVRREILPWLQYHTEMGVSRFYILYDGSDPEAVAALASIKHVRLIHIHDPFASLAEKAKFSVYASRTPEWEGRPGNYALMVKQGYGEQQALETARADGWDWLMHIDPDELFWPGGPVASVAGVLARQPAHVPSVRFMNWEGQPEAGDLTNRYEQVTLFRAHKHHITPEAHHYRYKYRLGDSAAFLTLYANGKAAVRVDAPGVKHLGPHFFTGDASDRWRTAANPGGAWVNLVSDDSVVLHLAYSYVADVEAKAHRSCPDEFLEAARRGDRAKVKACFVIDQDADAYVAAAQGRAAVEDFFYSRMVLSEGSRIRCADPGRRGGGEEGWCTLTDLPRFLYLMEKLGLYRRVLGPQVLLRQQERAMRRAARAAVAGGGGVQGGALP